MSTDIRYTAREAFAIAYCWAEFSEPENTSHGSPEAYWAKISEAARNECRKVANRLLLLAVARGQAVALATEYLQDHQFIADVAAELGMKQKERVRTMVAGVHKVARVKSRYWKDDATVRRDKKAIRAKVTGFAGDAP
jgi:hypothetical protein